MLTRHLNILKDPVPPLKTDNKRPTYKTHQRATVLSSIFYVLTVAYTAECLSPHIEGPSQKKKRKLEHFQQQACFIAFKCAVLTRCVKVNVGSEIQMSLLTQNISPGSAIVSLLLCD